MLNHGTMALSNLGYTCVDIASRYWLSVAFETTTTPNVDLTVEMSCAATKSSKQELQAAGTLAADTGSWKAIRVRKNNPAREYL